ncbi:WD40 repeat-like protein [Trichoderma citrinoviride]|uniref:WD40 repeat-like protein n=1 Tax=Trichoderma citrinoviride TaxID=58853 RepID=A0A2T4BFA1_9HYPO|nr:WD40 repeat-like protein [Trichoderma citrinoviride]PTB68017.1 WD40 repeat-like protein [Trichoderma citrinoviride]
MSSFFTVPGAQKKRKRPAAPEGPKKKVSASSKSSTKASAKSAKFAKPAAKQAAASTKKRVERDDDDDSISGSDSDESIESTSDATSDSDKDSDNEGETAAEKRLRLAERYLDNVREHVDEIGFDAAEIDRDLIAERLQEDVAESKGKVYRQLASELAFGSASQTLFRSNTNSVTSIAACAPYVYTTTKDLFLHKWRIQDLPQHQYPQTTKRKPKKPPAPPKKRPELEAWIRGNASKQQDRDYKRHSGNILCVAASSDGKFVVTGGQDKKIIVYDAETLKPLRVFTQHRDAVTGLAFRRGTNQLYSCSKDRTVKVFSLDELAYVETLFGHQDEVLDIDALAQERCISVGARDRTARLWKVAEETQLVFRGGAVDKKPQPGVNPRSLLHEGSMDRVAMIDDELFVTGSDNGSIALWSVAKKKPVFIQPLAHGLDPPLAPETASAEAHPDPKAVPAPLPRWITALKTIPYSDVILSGSWDGHVRIWKLSEDKKRIDLVATLGGSPEDDQPSEGNGDEETHSTPKTQYRPVHGVINDIAVFERGDRGQDGVCVVAAVAKDHRLGRWSVNKGNGVRNGGVVFEIPKIPRSLSNGAHKHGEEGGEVNGHDED